MLPEELIEQIYGFDSINAVYKKIAAGEERLDVTPFTGSVKNLIVKRLSEDKRNVVLLLDSRRKVSEFNVELQLLGLNEPVLIIDDFDNETILEKLTATTKHDNFVLISTTGILNVGLPSKTRVEENLIRITPGGDVTYEELLDYLGEYEYVKDKFVAGPGMFAQRGAIIDFWSHSEKNPVRLEFDGEFLESARFFDPESQRSIEKTPMVTLSGKLDTRADQNFDASIFDYIETPVVFASRHELDKNLESPAAAEDDESGFTDDPEIAEFDEDYKELAEEITESETEKDYLLRDEAESVFDLENITWVIEHEIHSDAVTSLGLKEPPSVNANYKRLFALLEEYSQKNYDIIIAAENELQTNRLRELVIETREEGYHFPDTELVKILTLPVREGFIKENDKFILLTDYQIFGKPYRSRLPAKKKYKKKRTKDFEEIKAGDFVVHEEYGIGRYAGLHTIKIGEVDQESMKLYYADDGVVYVNLNYLHLVKKFSGKEGVTPRLSVLGSNEWINTKKRTKKKIKELARDLIELYAKRKATPGFSFSPDTVWQKELEAAFIYEDTVDQSRVTTEVKEDLEADNPMDRLVCGDVGFGKTEIAVRAAFKCVQEGKQCGVLVPTTILAEQHFNTFIDRLSQFPVNIEVISRFQTKSKQSDIVKELEAGRVDIIIGTHRLLSKDIKFKDLGLLIIDEEHRFGVRAKEKLRAFKLNVDTLTMTATPIPRTLNLSLLGARDLSIIATPPPNRQPILTKVDVFNIEKIKKWIEAELNRDGQVYIIHDRVMTIDKFADYIHKHIPGLKLRVAHGKMKPSALENVIHDFLNKKFDVLVSTKIIESGIDIPNVNTIIVNRADRFGLAELHQLRGRVGRSDKQAFAYFIVPSLKTLNKNTLRRLKAIEEHSELGAGFNLAMRDLEIRGAGNLLGTEQSGFINQVGFDLYIKLINEAVEELKQNEFQEVFKELPESKERTDPTIDTNFEIGIPSAYMPDQSDRLNFYTTLLTIKELSELDDIKDELIDRFGPVPEMVERLFKTAELKFYAALALFERVIIQKKNIFLILPRPDNEKFYKEKFPELMKYIYKEYPAMKFRQLKDSMKLVLENRFREPEEIFEFLIDFCKETEEFYKGL